MNRITPASIVLSAAFAALLLTGCSAPSPAPTTDDEPATGQTVAEACEAALPEVEAAWEGLAEATMLLLSDPAAAETSFGDITASLRATADGLENADVSTAITDAAQGLDDLTGPTIAAIADPENADQEELEALGAESTAKFEALFELCGA